MERIRPLWKDRVLSKIYLIFYIVVATLTLPSSVVFPSAGLDRSWMIGINWAFLKGMQFGKDIIFTHGPLGFLYTPYLFDYNLWSASLSFNIFGHFVFFLSLLVLICKLNARYYDHILLLFTLIVTLPILSVEYKLVLTAVLLLYLLTISNLSATKNILVISFVSFLFAISSLIKFNAFIMSLGTITVFIIYIIANRNKNYNIKLILPSILFSYILFLLFLGLLAEQDSFSILQYINRGFEYSSGYIEAMALEGPQWQLLVGVSSLLIFFILILYSLIRKNSFLFVFLLLSFNFLFASFRHSFIRHDLHGLIFFASSSIVLVLTLMILKQGVKNARYKFLDKFSVFANVFIIIILILSIFVVSPGILNDNIVPKYPFIKQSISLIGNCELFDKVKQYNKDEIKKAYPVADEIVEQINNNTVDIFPWDIALLYAYDMNWLPRPMPQSITAYTEYLDTLNSQHFSNGKAPQSILYSYKSIDGRYPIFDEPSTFASILHNYTFVNKSGEFLLLSYNPKKNTPIKEENLGTVDVELDQPVTIPKYDSGFLFAHIKLEYSTFGKFMKLIYKPALSHIRFKFSDSSYSNEFRFIPGVSMDGVFLSQYVGNIDDLALVFSGNITQDISGIIIEADNPMYYKKYIKVKFVGVPANISIKKSSYRLPDWRMLKRVQGGKMAIDSVNKKLYAQESKVVNVDKNIEQFVEIRGWAVDDKAKDGTVKTYLVLSDKEKDIITLTKKTIRPDVAKHFGIESYKQSGWSTAIRSKEFKDRCYNISLRILRANGKEYYELNGNKPICFS